MAYENPLMRFLPPGAQEQAGYAGLGALAQALLAGGAPTTRPGGGIAAMGQGLGGFSQAYNQSLNSGLQQAMMGAQLAQAQRKEEQQAKAQAAIDQMFTAPPTQMAMAGDGRVGPTMQAAGSAPIAQMFPGQDTKNLQMLAQANPEGFMAALQARMMPKPNEGFTLKDGEARYDASGRLIVSGPEKMQTDVGKLIQERDKLPPNSPNRALYESAIQKALTEGGFRYGANGAMPVTGGPADPRYVGQKAGAEAAAQAPYKFYPIQPGGSLVPSPGVAGGQGGPTGAAYTDPRPAPNTQPGKIEEYLAERFVETQKAGIAAGNQDRQLEALGTLLDKAYTGTGADTVLSIQKGLASAGLDPNALGISSNMGAAEAGKAIAGQLALELRNPAGGAGMPGAMSDSDRNYLQAMSPSLANTKQGRELMIETRRALNQRSKEVAEFARQYARDKGGRLDLDFEDKLAQRFADKPLFGDSFYKKLEAAGGQSAPQTTQTPPNVIGRWNPKTGKVEPY